MRGEWRPRQVAVKIPRARNNSWTTVRAEIQVIKELNHENVCRMIGITCKFSKPLSIQIF